MKKPLILFAAVALLAATALAADLTGTWNVTVTLDAGSGTPTFELKQAGDKLTGTYTGQLGSADITGTVKDNDVTMNFVVQGANVVYKGKIDSTGKKMEGTCDYGGQASGTWVGTKK
jgi:hypothetical protein